MDTRKPIFYDEQQRRWRRTRRLLEFGGGAFTLLLIAFSVSVLSKPELPKLLLPAAHPALHALRVKPTAKKTAPRRPGRKRRVAALGRVPESYDPLQAAFYVSWDSTSFNALQLHYRDLDVLMPELLHAVSPDGRLMIDHDAKLAEWLASLDVELPTMALVNNYDGVVWRINEMAEMLANSAARARLTTSLVLYANSTRQAGLVLDFEEVPLRSQPHFRAFVRELAAALHKSNLKLMVALPAADFDYDYAYFAAHADAIILMDYDQHWPTSPPGPIAAQDWFAHNVEATLELVPADKLVIALANYAYDWTMPARGKPPVAQSVSFQQAIVTAQESEAQVEFDADSLNPHYSYDDEAGRRHDVWMLDGVTAANQLSAAKSAGVRGVALWRLGSEDPSLWTVWSATHPDDATRAKLQEAPPGYDLVLEGDGDIWRITATPQTGRREIRYEAATGMIVSERYLTYPMSYRIDQVGAAKRKIALSFDDGPDLRFTPRILDILKEKHVPAAFFVTGVAANNAPRLLERIYAEGHEIGNHTYTHPRFDQVSHQQLKYELNFTLRLLESRLGIKTILFRPPYGVDHQPESPSEVEMLPQVQEQGYVIVGSKIDPHDWGEAGGMAPPPAATIVSRVLEQVRAGKGNVMLLHDGGGDRSHTVAALPAIIDGLRAEGYEFVSLSSLLGQSRAVTMPALDPGEQWLARADAFVFDLYHWLRLGIAGVFLAGIGLVSLRALVIGLLALVEKMRPSRTDGAEYQPQVSVLIPAYNEEEVIVETVRSALGSDYAPLEVIVVDDGSADRTAERVQQEFGRDARVRFVQEPNRGKPFALNLGLAQAAGEIIVTIDADTSVAPDAITRLVRHFADPRVGAVAGNTKVSNRDRWITRWQALEYITSQNLEKRAFDLLNCITVVPGALGAWRAETLHAAGGFSSDTLAEDTDLTLAIRRRGWRILYDEEAIARTQAPETAEALVRQRFRWTFGTMQAFWKHRDALGRPRYGALGFVALPNIFLFQILLPLFSPLIDLLFAGSLTLWGLSLLHLGRVPQLWTGEDVERAVIFFSVFMLIDFLTCVVAFALERQEDWTLLAPLLLQRFYYRQMMYLVLFRALLRAWQGRAVGWGHAPPPVPRPVAHS